jgi:hypothetical protein
VSQETGRKTLYQLVRRWVEERGNAHHRSSVGKVFSRQGFRSSRLRFDGGAAPPDAENLIAIHLVVAVPSCATRKTVGWRGHPLLSSLTLLSKANANQSVVRRIE